MKLGAFSVSLTVKDIKASKSFYEKIGFIEFGGNINENWVIMKNGYTVIGLFQGMFDNNLLTFNPGWDQDINTLSEYDDIRKLSADFKTKGIDVIQEAIEGNSGPGSFSVTDPDGNVILFDQHV